MCLIITLGSIRIVEGLPYLLVVERLVRHIHREKIHAHAFDLLGPYSRVVFKSGELFHRNIVDDVALTGEQAGNR